MTRTGFVWKQIGRNRGLAMYVAEGNTLGLRPGDSIEVQRRDGTKNTYVVRCVTREDEHHGMARTCPLGTPEVRRPQES